MDSLQYLLCIAYLLNFCWCQQAEKGTPTTRVKLKSEFKENEMMRKRLNSKVEEENYHKKHKQQQKDKSCNKNKHRDFSGDSTLEQLKKEWDNVCTFIISCWISVLNEFLL